MPFVRPKEPFHTTRICGTKDSGDSMHVFRAWRAPAVAMAVLSLAASGAAQPAYFNLDFETSTRGQPWMWYEVGPGY